MHRRNEGLGMILFVPACLPQLALAPDTLRLADSFPSKCNFRNDKLILSSG